MKTVTENKWTNLDEEISWESSKENCESMIFFKGLIFLLALFIAYFTLFNIKEYSGLEMDGFITCSHFVWSFGLSESIDFRI